MDGHGLDGVPALFKFFSVRNTVGNCGIGYKNNLWLTYAIIVVPRPCGAGHVLNKEVHVQKIHTIWT